MKDLDTFTHRNGVRPNTVEYFLTEPHSYGPGNKYDHLTDPDITVEALAAVVRAGEAKRRDAERTRILAGSRQTLRRTAVRIDAGS